VTPAERARLEDAIIVASLAHACARTPAERRVAWAKLAELKQKTKEQRAG